MRVKSALTLLVVLLALFLAGALLFLPLFGEPLLSLRRLIRSRERTFSSRELLSEINDVLELQTVEYVYRMVFPHDFYTPGITLEAIFDRLASQAGAPQEILTREELAYLEAYNLAWEIGYPTTSDGEAFVVITARVRGGYDLSMELEGLLRLEPLDGAAERSEELTPEESRVIVSLPPAAVVAVVIEDLNSENYPYPPARVDAEEWRAISSLVRDAASWRSIEAGVLEEAESRARGFLETLLREAGFGEIRFHDG